MSPNSNSVSVQVCLLANALVHRLPEQGPLLPGLETNTQLNTEVCDDGQRDAFALDGILVRCSTCIPVSSNPASISKKVLSHPYKVKRGK